MEMLAKKYIALAAKLLKQLSKFWNQNAVALEPRTGAISSRYFHEWSEEKLGLLGQELQTQELQCIKHDSVRTIS